MVPSLDLVVTEESLRVTGDGRCDFFKGVLDPST